MPASCHAPVLPVKRRRAVPAQQLFEIGAQPQFLMADGFRAVSGTTVIAQAVEFQPGFQRNTAPPEIIARFAQSPLRVVAA